MYDTIYELTNQLKLKNMIINDFIPPEEFRKYEQVTTWNEEDNDWQINHPANINNNQNKKENRRP